MSQFNVINYEADSVLVMNGNKIKVIFIRELNTITTKNEEGGDDSIYSIFKLGTDHVIFSHNK